MISPSSEFHFTSFTLLRLEEEILGRTNLSQILHITCTRQYLFAAKNRNIMPELPYFLNLSYCSYSLQEKMHFSYEIMEI